MDVLESLLMVYCIESEGSMISEDREGFLRVYLEKELLGYLIVLFLDDVLFNYF